MVFVLYDILYICLLVVELAFAYFTTNNEFAISYESTTFQSTQILEHMFGHGFKAQQLMGLLPTQTRQIQVTIHSYFSYKHYSHFSDHCALQALPKIAK